MFQNGDIKIKSLNGDESGYGYGNGNGSGSST